MNILPACSSILCVLLLLATPPLRAQSDVAGPPVIDQIIPASGSAGTVIAIEGTNFIDVASVRFGGVEAASFLFSTTTNGTAVVPANAVTGPITLVAVGGKVTSSLEFTITNSVLPVIHEFSPVSGPPGTSVELRGTNLVEVRSVSFNGLEASFTTFPGTLVATVPAAATTGPITIVTAAGTHTTTANFTVLELVPPVITGFNPTTGEPGVSVRLEGANLAGVTSVQFNGVAAPFTLFSGALAATVPAGATSGPITVTTPGGTVTTSASFTVTEALRPGLTSFTPASGETGISVQIRGVNLLNVTAVEFNGVNAPFTLFAGIIFSTVPATATTGPITVRTAAGSVTSTEVFTVNPRPAPVITSISPLSGAAGSGVQIRGANLAGLSSVKFNDVEATFTIFAGIVFTTVPENASSGPLSVTTSAGTASSAETFTVVALEGPIISGFSPGRGTPGTAVQIDGTSFISVTSVLFNGVSATFTNLFAGRIAAIVPANATTGPITVATPVGTNTSTEVFTIPGAAVPTITIIAPLSGEPGTQVFFRGTDLDGVTSVQFSGTEALFVQFSAELVMAHVPTNAVSGPVTLFTAGGTATSGEPFTILNPVPQEPPTLSIRVAGQNQLQISWPVIAVGFVLQVSETLTAGSWTNLDAAVTPSDGNNVVDIPVEPGRRFYRLARP